MCGCGRGGDTEHAGAAEVRERVRVMVAEMRQRVTGLKEEANVHVCNCRVP